MAEHAKFRVEVLTPDGEVFADDVQMVSTKTAVGSIGILAHHEPLLAMLDPTELRLYRSDSDVVRFAQSEGYLQVGNDQALILIQEAHEPGALDAGDLRDRLQRAERELEEAGDDTERRRVAEREKRRLDAFIRITEAA
jgi:F-type H+-transporting ATPase subunit epsilon